jgi:serine/arginine repetitive matrix protein 2
MDMIHAANEATRRRANGEDMGAPPIPTMASKRRYDTSQPLVPRTLAPSTDGLDVEQSPTLQSAVPAHVSPPQFAAQTRFPLSQSNRALPASAPGQPQEGHGASQGSPSRSAHGPGPRMGFFLDDRSHPQQPPPLHTITQSALLPDDQRIQTPIERIKTEYEPNPSRPLFTQQNADRDRERDRAQRDRDHDREREMLIQQQQQQQLRDSHFAQMRAKEDAEAQKLLDRQANPYARGQQPNPFHGLGSQQPSMLQNRHISSEPGRQEQRGPWGAPVSTAASGARTVVDLTAQPTTSKYDPLPRSGRPVSPVPRVAQVSQPAQPSSRPQAAPEPSKRVNIMSMLNPEPEEDRPRKRESEQSAPPSASTPGQQYRGLPNTNSEPSTASREHNEIPRSFSRPSFHSAHQTPNSSLSTPISESAPRDPLSSIHRDSWQSRQSFQQQSQQTHPVGSPHTQQQHTPQMHETRQTMFNRDYRTQAFSSLNQQPRANPSPPPPGGAFPHSRTPSFSQQQHGQHPAGTSSAAPGPSLNLRNNPYAHKEPSSGHSSHLSGSQVPPASARNDLAHGANQFTIAQMQSQRDARFDRFREREAEPGARERDPGPAQPPRFGQHTPPGTQHRYPPPERTGHTPLQHLGYAPPEGQPPRLADQRAMEYHQELLRRDQERARQREERLLQEARHAQEIQEQAQKRAQDDDLRRRQMEQQQWRSHADRYGPGR